MLAAGAALAGAGIGVWLSPARAAVERSAYDVCIEASMSAPGYAVEVCEPLAPWWVEPLEDEPGWDCRLHGNRSCVASVTP